MDSVPDDVAVSVEAQVRTYLAAKDHVGAVGECMLRLNCNRDAAEAIVRLIGSTPCTSPEIHDALRKALMGNGPIDGTRVRSAAAKQPITSDQSAGRADHAEPCGKPSNEKKTGKMNLYSYIRCPNCDREIKAAGLGWHVFMLLAGLGNMLVGVCGLYWSFTSGISGGEVVVLGSVALVMLVIGMHGALNELQQILTNQMKSKCRKCGTQFSAKIK